MIIDFRIQGTGKKFFPGGLSAMPQFMARYKELYDFKRLCELPFQEFVCEMEKNGIKKAVLHAEFAYGNIDQLNKAVGETVKEYPDKLIGFAGLNPLSSENPLTDIERYFNEWNMKGLNLQTCVQGWYANDRRLYPIYAYCQENKIPVAIHSSINFMMNRKIDYGHPLHLQEIACAFPDLTIIANHGGWPWVIEMVAVAWKHPNVYIDIGGISPKYIAKPGTGWEPFLTYGNSILQDQILFATDSLIPHRRVLSEVEMLPLKENVKKSCCTRMP